MYISFSTLSHFIGQADTHSLKVLRYSALGGGVLYGYTHQASITAKTKILQAERERAHQASIKEKAHEAFVRRNDPKPEGNGGKLLLGIIYFVGLVTKNSEEEEHRVRPYRMIIKLKNDHVRCGFGKERLIFIFALTVITDPDDSRFDLEAYLNMIAKENP